MDAFVFHPKFDGDLVVFVTTSLVAASAFTVPVATIPATKLSESFGFDFAEDTYANQPDFLKGEGEYKTWIGQTKENSFVNRQVSSVVLV